MSVWIAQVRDQDGYYIPVFAADSEEEAKQLMQQFKNREKKNKYWDFDFIQYWEVKKPSLCVDETRKVK